MLLASFLFFRRVWDITSFRCGRSGPFRHLRVAVEDGAVGGRRSASEGNLWNDRLLPIARTQSWSGIIAVVRARKAAKRWFTDRGAPADTRRDEALRKVGAKILNEPIPEKLQQALRGKQGKAEVEPKRRK
jgi:hypothetical protein